MRFLCALTVLALTLPGCDGSGAATAPGPQGAVGEGAQAKDQGEILAEVGGLSVSETEFSTMAARKTPANGSTLSDDEKREVLDKLVEERILYIKALERGLDQDPKVQKVMVNALLREEVYSQVRNADFNDEELRAYYEEHLEEFVVPEKVQIKRILVRVTGERDREAAEAEAKRIRQEVVRDPNDFKTLATKYSEGPYKRHGGDLGFVSREGKPGVEPGIVTKAFDMDVGDVSEPFSTDDGFNVIYIANHRKKVERTFQQMKGSVLRKLKNERLQEMYDAYVEGLRTGVEVSVDEAKLANVEVEAAGRPGLRPGSLQPGGHGGTVPTLQNGGADLGAQPAGPGGEVGNPHPELPGSGK